MYNVITYIVPNATGVALISRPIDLGYLNDPIHIDVK